MKTRRGGPARKHPPLVSAAWACLMYGPAGETESVATIHGALDAGITLLDSGDFYGMGHNEMLLARALRGVPRDGYLLSVKFGGQTKPR